MLTSLQHAGVCPAGLLTKHIQRGLGLGQTDRRTVRWSVPAGILRYCDLLKPYQGVKYLEEGSLLCTVHNKVFLPINPCKQTC